MTTVYLGLGSNIANREETLRAAVNRLNSEEIRVLRVSPIYESEPVDYTDQPWFLNMVVEADTDLSPDVLLARTAEIERQLGRVREVPKGPRTIDIDILLYGDVTVRTPALEIPHPRMEVRRFVLVPLADLAPNVRHPVSGRTIRELLAGAPPAAIRLLNS